MVILQRPITRSKSNILKPKVKKRSEQPVSRILFPRPVTRIRGDDHSSGMPIARHLTRPTRELGRATLQALRKKLFFRRP